MKNEEQPVKKVEKLRKKIVENKWGKIVEKWQKSRT